MNTEARNLCWFGKLPCVGDFCSHNMSAEMLETLDVWFSNVMQQGQTEHGNAWVNAYFQTPVHGFVWGQHVFPALHNEGAIGVIMPSVDKAGRAFPFVLLETAPVQTLANLSFDSITGWFHQAYALCADALNEDWSLSKLQVELQTLPRLMNQSISMDGVEILPAHSHWFRIEFEGGIRSVLQCQGLPAGHDFNTLLGLDTTPW